MKTVQSIVIAASIILVSANAVAGTIQSGGGFDRVVNNTIVLSAAPTKQAAYQLGLNKLAQLNASSPQQLGLMLNVISSNAEGNTLHLKDGGYITVQERMSTGGNTTYVSSVNVGLHYLERNDNN
ncbi:DUF3316 domain-containing protein [Leucothrix pacifica]|nr:DUF3316 domain-containing protein [Leucothrix pacifica]